MQVWITLFVSACRQKCKNLLLTCNGEFIPAKADRAAGVWNREPKSFNELRCRSECCCLTSACDGDRLWPNAFCVYYSYSVHCQSFNQQLKMKPTSTQNLCVLFLCFTRCGVDSLMKMPFSPDLPCEATFWGNWLMCIHQPLSFIVFSEKNELPLLGSPALFYSTLCSHVLSHIYFGAFHIFCSCSVFFIFYLCNLVTMMRVVWRIWACGDQYLQTVAAGLKSTNCQNYFQNELQ